MRDITNIHSCYFLLLRHLSTFFRHSRLRGLESGEKTRHPTNLVEPREGLGTL